MWAGDCSFDHHNEEDPTANDPINAPPIETEFMNLDKEVHRGPM